MSLLGSRLGSLADSLLPSLLGLHLGMQNSSFLVSLDGNDPEFHGFI
jgi:hypothetical protein